MLVMGKVEQGGVRRLKVLREDGGEYSALRRANSESKGYNYGQESRGKEGEERVLWGE